MERENLNLEYIQLTNKFEYMHKLLFYFIEFIGISILFTGIVFRVNNYPEVFNGIIVGPIVIVIGLLTLFINKENFNYITNSISSRITPIYKIFSLIFCVIFLIFIVYTFLLKNPDEIFNYLIIFEILIIIAIFHFIYLIIHIKNMYIKAETITITDFFSKYEKQIKNVIYVKRYFILFYKIKFEKSFILIIPHFSEFLKDILDEPESIRRFKNTLYESKLKKM